MKELGIFNSYQLSQRFSNSFELVGWIWTAGFLIMSQHPGLTLLLSSP